MQSKIKHAYSLLPPELRKTVQSFGHESEIDEIRLRSQGSLSLVISGRELILNARVTAQDIEYCFEKAFSYSLHSHIKELCDGSVTAPGGNRVGFCGRAAINSGKIDSVRDISSVSIRIAREIIGCADGIAAECFSEAPCGLLIIGRPSSGKTTLLRDISRQLAAKYSVSLIDERGELSAMLDGTPQNDVGNLSDIFFMYPKPEAIETAVRAMSPKAIIADEIFRPADGEALLSAHASGIAVITAAHGTDLMSAEKNPAVKLLLENGVFKYCALLSNDRAPKVTALD